MLLKNKFIQLDTYACSLSLIFHLAGYRPTGINVMSVSVGPLQILLRELLIFEKFS